MEPKRAQPSIHTSYTSLASFISLEDASGHLRRGRPDPEDASCHLRRGRPEPEDASSHLRRGRPGVQGFCFKPFSVESDFIKASLIIA